MADGITPPDRGAAVGGVRLDGDAAGGERGIGLTLDGGAGRPGVQTQPEPPPPAAENADLPSLGPIR